MKAVKSVSVVALAGGLVAVALAAAPSASGQAQSPSPQARSEKPETSRAPDRRARRMAVLAGRGAEIGVSIRDVTADERQKSGAGVVVTDVRPGSPAEQAGVRKADVIVEFDGERVRGVRQFARLVQETPAGQAVKAAVMRDGRRTDVQLEPEERRAEVLLDGDHVGRLAELGHLDERIAEGLGSLRNLPFAMDFDVARQPGARSRLGITVQKLTPQLATFFGAKDGVLLSSVSEDSPAARAGLKAGDVIASVNGKAVTARADLVRAVRDTSEGTITLGIVRDKKDSTVTVNSRESGGGSRQENR